MYARTGAHAGARPRRRRLLRNAHNCPAHRKALIEALTRSGRRRPASTYRSSNRCGGHPNVLIGYMHTATRHLGYMSLAVTRTDSLIGETADNAPRRPTNPQTDFRYTSGT